MIDDTEATGIFADIIIEALESRDPQKQREALLLSEHLAWQTKCLEGHRDFIRDCGGLLVDDNIGLFSLLRATWKIRFWESLDEPLRTLLNQCDFDIVMPESSVVSLEIRCPNNADVFYLNQLQSSVREKFSQFAGYDVDVRLRSLEMEFI